MSNESQNDYDMMEFKVLQCLLEKDYDELLKKFGIDKNKSMYEVMQKFQMDPSSTPEHKAWLQDLQAKLKQP